MNSSETALDAALVEYTDRISNKVESRLSDESPVTLYEAARHPVRAGEKQLSSTICLLVAEALGVDTDGQAAIMPAAVAIELVRTFSSVHTDLIEGDTMHRGEPAVDTKWDSPTAILAGDVLFAKASEILLDTDAPADTLLTCQSELLSGCRKFCEGLALEHSFQRERGHSPTETEYIEMARLKTGALFEASARIGAILAMNNEEYTNRVGAYGRNLGIAQLLYNDILAITDEGETPGKKPCSNTHSRKETLISVHARRKGLDISAINSKKLVPELQSSGSIAYTQERAEEYSQTAQKFLEPLPETTARQHLCELVVSSATHD
jgi:geranylgeranyl diphosphate synthase type I